MENTTIIIPTYNEAENLPELVRRIRACVDSTVQILVMDDSPNIDTASVARKLGCETVHRVYDRGLSKAVIEGILYSQAEKVIVMDADLQHPPEVLPKLIEALDKHDFVTASRYVKGGGCRHWDLDRKVISRIANLAARPLHPRVKDLVSGFFGFQRAGLPELSTVNTRGFKIMLELLCRGRWQNPVEIPFTFEDRTRGESKLGAGKITDYILQLIPLYLHEFRILRFGMVGALGALVGFPILYTLTEFAGLYYIVSAVIAIVCASTSNYFFNNLWTFREKRRRGKGHIAGWLNYQMLSAGGDGLYLGLLFLLTSIVGVWYMLSAVISVGAVFVLKYLFANKVIWKAKHST